MALAQPGTGEIRKSQDGKYILFEKGKAIDTYGQDSQVKYYAYHRFIPVGSNIRIKSLETGKSLVVKVVDTLRLRDKSIIVELSYDVFQVLLKKGSFSSELHVEISYQTPIDSLLSLLETQESAEHLKTYLMLTKIYQPYQPEEAINYLRQAILLAQELKDPDREAEAWLILGDIQNEMVETEIIGYDYYYDTTPTDVKLKQISEKTGFSQKDIIRWNHIGGHSYYLRTLFGYNDDVVLYPHPEQLSDSAYVQYLKIRETQKDPDKIIWGLKKLGDLYRIKVGYEKAETYYLKILDLREKGDDPDKTAWIWGYLAEFYWEQKNYQEAERYFQKLYNLREKTKKQDLWRLIWAIGGLRNLSYTEGNVSKALDYQREIFKIYRLLDKFEWEWTLRVVIRDYIEVFKDRKEEILKYLIKWLNGKEKMLPIEKIILAENIAALAGEMQDYEKAAKILIRVIDEYKKSSDKIHTINDIAFYYQKAEKFKKSLRYYYNGLDIARKLNHKTIEAIQYYKIAYFYDYQDQFKTADGWYKKSIETLRLQKSHSIEEDRIIKQLFQMISYLSEKHKSKPWALGFAIEGQRIVNSPYYQREFQRIAERLRR